MKAFIYLLRDPYTVKLVKSGLHTKIRYVGKTNNPDIRWRNHFSGNGTKRMKKWIDSLKKEGKHPKLEVIDECSESNWHKREEFFIRKYRKLGHPLLNTYKGIKTRTDDEIRKKIKKELLDGEYFRLKDGYNRIVVRVGKNTYYKVYGNLINGAFNDTTKVKAGSYYIIISNHRYIVPASTIIYSTKGADLPELVDDKGVPILGI
jgi:hypothetical protein